MLSKATFCFILLCFVITPRRVVLGEASWLDEFALGAQCSESLGADEKDALKEHVNMLLRR